MLAPELRLTCTFLCSFCPCRPSAARWSTARASASSRGRFTYGRVTTANTAGWPTVSRTDIHVLSNKREISRAKSAQIGLTARQLSVLGIGLKKHCAETPVSNFFAGSCVRFFFPLLKLLLLCGASKQKAEENEENPTTARHIIRLKTTRYEFFTQGIKREQESTKG